MAEEDPVANLHSVSLTVVHASPIGIGTARMEGCVVSRCGTSCTADGNMDQSTEVINLDWPNLGQDLRQIGAVRQTNGQPP